MCYDGTTCGHRTYHVFVDYAALCFFSDRPIDCQSPECSFLRRRFFTCERACACVVHIETVPQR